MSALRSVTIVIVNWNGRHHLEACLPSLAALAYPPELLETIVFDNGSTDGSAEWLVSAWPGARLIRSATNLGFAAACNRAVEAAGGELVAFVNNDLRVEATWLRRLVEALAATGAAAAGSRILDWEGRHHDFDGAAMNFYGHGISRRHGVPCDDTAPGDPVPALFACGAAMVVDRARFVASGGFDPDYFAYFEDVDLGWRLWVEGARVVHVPAAVAFHRHHGSGLPADAHTRLLERNALASVIKNYDDDNLAVVLPAALALLAARARLAAGTQAAIFADTARDLAARRPALDAKRAVVQSRRRRPDREILPLFLEPFRPSFFGSAYWAEQCRVVETSGVGHLFEAADPAALARGLDAFVAELQARVETLQHELGRAEAAAAALAEGHARVAVEGARPQGAHEAGGERGLWRALIGRRS